MLVSPSGISRSLNGCEQFCFRHGNDVRKCWTSKPRGSRKVGVKCAEKNGERPCVEDDPRYRRVDFSGKLAYDARLAFAKNVSKGDAAMDLALASLQIAAEDDGLISTSPVAFPIQSFVTRIDRIAQDIAKRLASKFPNGPPPPEHAIPLIEKCLFEEQKLKIAPFGRSNLKENSVIDHPGVWEDQTFAYMHEALIRRVGVPAILTVLYQDIMKRLLMLEAIDFTVTMDCKDFDEFPKPQVLKGLTREVVMREDGCMLNTCTSDALVEILQYLKRAFWPFSWDTNLGNGGGFRGAADMLLGEASSEYEAISRTAKHRLDRGIFTTTGGGDIRRAVAACERLVMMCPDQPTERRDLALMLLHFGEMGRANAELKAYMDTEEFRQDSLEDKVLTQQVWEFLQAAPIGDDETHSLMSIETVLEMPAPVVQTEKRIPLTW